MLDQQYALVALVSYDAVYDTLIKLLNMSRLRECIALQQLELHQTTMLTGVNGGQKAHCKYLPLGTEISVSWTPEQDGVKFSTSPFVGKRWGSHVMASCWACHLPYLAAREHYGPGPHIGSLHAMPTVVRGPPGCSVQMLYEEGVTEGEQILPN